MEHVLFAKEELERRKKSPVLAQAGEIMTQIEKHNHVYFEYRRALERLPQAERPRLLVFEQRTSGAWSETRWG